MHMLWEKRPNTRMQPRPTKTNPKKDRYTVPTTTNNVQTETKALSLNHEMQISSSLYSLSLIAF